ncbi:MAG: hypothetical protein JF627_04225 [Alphaproteobacteria bacterium]|nr:hypothetical protein [Alphaproteobacteria bacterium]
MPPVIQPQSFLVQILLPLRDNNGRKFPDAIFTGIQDVLTERFGGLTAYGRAPAQGIWARGRRKMRDDIVVVEVMVPRLDAKWWKGFRRRLEKALGQEQLVIRVQRMTVL